jgi:hypothetical protein
MEYMSRRTAALITLVVVLVVNLGDLSQVVCSMAASAGPSHACCASAKGRLESSCCEAVPRQEVVATPVSPQSAVIQLAGGSAMPLLDHTVLELQVSHPRPALTLVVLRI